MTAPTTVAEALRAIQGNKWGVKIKRGNSGALFAVSAPSSPGRIYFECTTNSLAEAVAIATQVIADLDVFEERDGA